LALENAMTNRFISTAIPYVNAAPHIGFALELVITDVLARYARRRGADVYFLSGTDENSLKNALAAAAAGERVHDFVARHAAEYAALRTTLDLSYDDFLRTSADPRHAPAVTKLWEACARHGDIYAGDYAGLYCVGCEQFLAADELVDGLCAEHRMSPERVAERNYFFRLSRYRDALVALHERGAIAIRPTQRRNEVLAFLEQPLGDLSISRSVERAHGWGLPVPGDASQIVYVWFDALANYISALGYAHCGAPFERYWTHAERISHVIGKGVIRFHAVYWPALLLSAGVRVPSELLVHGYVTVEGRKIGKSLGNAVAPRDACAVYGTDALRYYLLRHVGSQRDGDFSWSRFDEIYAHELANDLGNLVTRVTALGRRYGVPPGGAAASELADGLAAKVHAHLEEFALDRALDEIWAVIGAANAYVNRTAPWQLARQARSSELRATLSELYAVLRALGSVLEPFLPETARRLSAALDTSAAVQLFPRERSAPCVAATQ
jgi:methionyl-tRNA synthetase